MIPAAFTGSAARYLAVLAIGAGAPWWVQSLRSGVTVARTAQAHAEQVEEWASAANAALLAAQTEGQRRAAALEKTLAQEKTLSTDARSDADKLNRELVGLRKYLDSVHRDAASRDSILAEGSPAGASAAGMLAYMLSRAIGRAEFLASYADSARIAGLTCERSYDGLTREDRGYCLTIIDSGAALGISHSLFGSSTPSIEW